MNEINHERTATKVLTTNRVAIGLALLISICMGVSDAGITRNGIKGRIKGFGSIIVNDREIDIATSTVTFDGDVLIGGDPETRDLKLGQVVFVIAEFDDVTLQTTALEVFFDDNVEGPISSIDRRKKRLDVLGLSILVDTGTVFELLSGPNKFSALSVDDQIEVSGFLTAQGEVIASRIEQKPTMGAQHEVTGVVSNLDLVNNTFSLNQQIVAFTVDGLKNFDGENIENGNRVEAKGFTFGAAGELIATQVELQVDLKDVFAAEAIAVGEFEGLITNFDSVESFSIADVAVTTDGSTVFVGGGPGNLTDNTSVEVRGLFKNGILVADDVTIRGTRIRIHAPVDLVDADADPQSLTVLGIQATVDDELTKVVDNSSVHSKPFDLSLLYPGNFVEVRSVINPGPGTPFDARRVIRTNPDADLRLQGFVDSVGSQDFTLHGVPVHIGEKPSFTDANGKDMSEDEFFDVLTIGTFVKVLGTGDVSVGITATQISLALED